MKTPSILILTILALTFVGCDDDNDNVVKVVDQVPATPQGVYSVTGDDTVTVYWNGIYDTDVDYYRVYRSLDAVNGYAVIASITAEDNPQLNLLLYSYDDASAHNGTTYWYAVSAVDHAGQESELSAEEVFDTPRPAGSATVYSYDADSAHAGFSLTLGVVVAWNAGSADFFVDRYDDVYYINAANALTDIQDLGYTNSFDDVGWAPDTGWSALGYCEAIAGHTYVIWTADDHYAKVRISSIGVSGAIAFDWGWQSVQSNLELAPMRPTHTDEFGQPKRTVVGQLIK
jgi:hypothetical protein